MSRFLLIVESPGKIKTLRQILGPEWSIEASIGHTTELASDGPRKLGFDFKNGKIDARYTPRGDRGKAVLSKLKQAVQKVNTVYLATDPDREGEAIAWHLAEQLKLKNFYRVTYTQITAAAVKKAIAQPGTLNSDLIFSQRARQCLDKLVGYSVSPLLWNSTGGKSAGRVQSATLHLICERERERLQFKPENYWTLKSKYGEGFDADYEIIIPKILSKEETPKALSTENERPKVRIEEEANRIAEVARTNPHIVQDNERRNEFRSAPPPLITSSLQQVAGVKYRFSPKHTMKVAQELYEGIRGKGLITYMRTDAVELSPEFIAETREWLTQHSPESLPLNAPSHKAKADAQAAHEAIRPTEVAQTPEKVQTLLTPDQLKLYTLIWERAVASQCKPAQLSKTKITIKAADTFWISKGTTVLEQGYLKFWKNLDQEKELPLVTSGQTLKFEDVAISAQTTQPPPRYSEPRLVQLMERKGIGRPSTYASTIATLKDRDYVVLEKMVLVPTHLGMETDQALGKAMPDLVNTDFTATMEKALDSIAEGKLQWEKYLTEWNDSYLVPAIESAKKTLSDTVRIAPLENKTGPAKAFIPSAADSEKIEKAFSKAKKNKAVPSCPKNHGELSLRISAKKTFYWKCTEAGCEEFAWFKDFASFKCPTCQNGMEKIPSKKVTGGYFLKCIRKDQHPQEVVLFKNKKTKEWESPHSKVL